MDVLVGEMFQKGLVEQCTLDDVQVLKKSGQPILNVCFGVHKRWETVQGTECCCIPRFISNLVSCASVLLPICGAVQQLGNRPLYSDGPRPRS
eukprot:2338829-Amphidinium_carterae.1